MGSLSHSPLPKFLIAHIPCNSPVINHNQFRVKLHPTASAVKIEAAWSSKTFMLFYNTMQYKTSRRMQPQQWKWKPGRLNKVIRKPQTADQTWWLPNPQALVWSQVSPCGCMVHTEHLNRYFSGYVHLPLSVSFHHFSMLVRLSTFYATQFKLRKNWQLP
jgi:hypothetical protein